MSNNQSHDRKPSSQKKKHAPKRAPRKGTDGSPFSSAFVAKVEKLDKLMQLAAKPTPPAPAGFVLVRKDGEGGTLEQVGREADNAWAGVKNIMRLLNVETKACDFSGTLTVDRSGTVVDLLANISQGVADNQRTGDGLKINRITIHAYAASTNGFTPVVCVLGRSRDGLPGPADVFETFNTAFSGLSNKKWDYKAADTWLESRRFVIDGALGSDKYTHLFTFEHSKGDMHAQFFNGGVSVVSGALWFAVQSNLAVNQPTLQYTCRVEFVDN
jgi:hypothetical protein